MESKKSKFTGYMLFAVFVVPLMLAIAMYVMRGDSSEIKTVAHGDLIHPAQPIVNLEVSLNADKTFTLDNLQGKWSYVLFIQDGCDLNCEAALFKVRQTRLATGREASRIQSLMLLGTQDASVNVDAEVLKRNPKIVFGNLTQIEISDEVEVEETLQPNYIYLVDPNGNLMMRYDEFATSKGMLKDIKKLLKLSNIG